MDVGRILRLQGAVKSAATSVREDDAVVGAGAMMQSYARLRHEVRDAIPEDDIAEFERMFPAEAPHDTGTSGSRMLIQAGRFHAARSLLEQIAGWLDGYVQQARNQAEAQANAEARAKVERESRYQG